MSAENGTVVGSSEELVNDVEPQIPGEVAPGDSAETETDGRKTRTKKLVYPVPEDKLTYPFDEDLEPWSLDYGKLKEDDFRDTESFEKWECYEYHELRLQRLEATFLEKRAPIVAEQEKIRIKLEESKRVCDELQITDDKAKAAISDALGLASAAKEAGVSYEQFMQAIALLQQGE